MVTNDSSMYSRVSFKASHNSYTRSEQPVTDQLDRPPTKSPHQAGCRGLELDLVESHRLWHWSVKHDGEYDGGTDMQLAAYLRHIRLWSSRFPDHDVITVTLDLKGTTKDTDDFAYFLDHTIDEHLGADLLFTPGELQGKHKSLVAGAAAHGWPTIPDLTGRFIMCLSGDERTKRAYAGSRTRLAFADLKVSAGTLPSATEGDRVFLNFDIGDSGWQEGVRAASRSHAFVSRVYTANDQATWSAALRSKANIVSTDKVRNHPWATVGSTSLFRPF